MVRKIFYESTVYTYIDFHSKIFILSEIGFRAVNKESQNTQIFKKNMHTLWFLNRNQFHWNICYNIIIFLL